MIEEQHVEIIIPVEIEKGRLCRERCIVEVILLCFVGKRKVSVVNQENISSSHTIRTCGPANVYIQKTIIVNIHHRNAGLPTRFASCPGLLRDILEFEVTFIQV